MVIASASYIRDYSIPLIETARSDPAAARTVAATEEGKRRVDALRTEFDGLVAIEDALAAGEGTALLVDLPVAARDSS